MTIVVTLTERRQRRIDAIRAALPTLDAALADYGRQHGGRFIRYGSTVTGRIHPASDVDLLADFPPDRETGAWQMAEDLCWSLGLKPDVLPVGRLKPGGLERAIEEPAVNAILWDRIASSKRHFAAATAMYDENGREGLLDCKNAMAFMHAMQVGYTSFEAAMKRLLLILGEPLPLGEDAQKALLRRVSKPIPDGRPEILNASIAYEAGELRRFHDFALVTTDDFDPDLAERPVRAAKLFIAGIDAEIARFQAAIDPA